jgi:hypothetical protein
MSVAIDKSRSRENIVGFFVEAIIGLMMLSVLLSVTLVAPPHTTN